MDSVTQADFGETEWIASTTDLFTARVRDHVEDPVDLRTRREVRRQRVLASGFLDGEDLAAALSAALEDMALNRRLCSTGGR